MTVRDWIDKIIPPRPVAEKGYSAARWNRIFDGQTSDVLDDYGEVGDPYQTNATVYAAVRKKATNISGVPFEIRTPGPDGEPIAENQVTRLFDNPSVNQGKYHFWEAIVSNLELRGKAYIHLAELLHGIPAAMFCLNTDLMKTIKGKDGSPEKYEYGRGDKKQTYMPEEIVFINYWHPSDPFDGLSPITAARLGILLQYYANQYNINFFKQGGLMKGFFKNTAERALTREQEGELQKSISDKGGGRHNAHKVPVFSGVEYVPVGISQKDMEFLRLQAYTRDELLALLGTPKAVLGFTEAVNYSNMKEIRRDFWNKSLVPIMRLMESAFELQFFDRFSLPYEGEFNLDTIPELQEDLGEISRIAERFRKMGVPFAIINERLALGFPEFEVVTPLALAPPAPPEAPKAADIAKELHDLGKREKMQERVASEKAIPFDRHLRRAEAKATERKLEIIERGMEPQIRDFWKGAKAELMEWFTAEKGQKAEGLSEEFVRAFLSWVEDVDWGGDLFKTVEPDIEDAFLAGEKRTFWGVGARFDLPSTDAVIHLHQRGVKIKESVDVIKDALVKGIEEGTTTDQLSKQIQAVFKNADEVRSTLIARTETTAAYNGGRIEGMKRLGIKRKQWINAEDGKVRESHQTNEIVDRDRAFTLTSGVRVMYPGDGPPSEACNCRCTVVSVILDGDDLEV